MTCPLPAPSWWQKYVLGAFKTPQDLVAAARAENPDPAQASDRWLEIPEMGPNWNVPERLKAPQHLKTENYLRQTRRADWTHADPRLIVWSAIFQKMMEKRGIPLYVHSCLRGKAEQNDLVAKGNSKVRYPNSAHNIGEAVDIVHGVFHWDLNKDEWHMLYVIGMLALDRLNQTLKAANKLQLVWGGKWSFYDPAHWEVADYRSRSRTLSAPITPRLIGPNYALSIKDQLLAGL